MYLHELGEEAASFTKEEMQVGYELIIVASLSDKLYHKTNIH